jgi:serine/threonine protein kinase
MNSDERAPCDGCSAPLPIGITDGLCPRCLLAGALDSGLLDDPPSSDTTDEETVLGSSASSPRAPVPSLEKAGDTIGRYKLLQQIGEGGFGVVYLAEQTEPVKRKFLALMDHPNIAKAHDAGATAHGRPYFVMELVKGVPLTAYCADQQLDNSPWRTRSWPRSTSASSSIGKNFGRCATSTRPRRPSSRT